MPTKVGDTGVSGIGRRVWGLGSWVLGLGSGVWDGRDGTGGIWLIGDHGLIVRAWALMICKLFLGAGEGTVVAGSAIGGQLESMLD